MERLIRKLREHDIDVDVVRNKLNLNIPDNLDAGNVIEEVRANKAELISFIKKMKELGGFKVIEPAPEKDHYVLSSAQKRLYFLNRFDQSSIAYNMPQITHIKGKSDKVKLKEALNKLIVRHESLRTSFEVIDDVPVQKISKDISIDLEYYQASEDQVPSTIKQFVRPFNLSEAPLFRAAIIERSDAGENESEDHIFMIDMHHIIGDGVSLGILLNDFMKYYQGHTPLPELRLQYKDFSEWQQGKYENELADKKDFWLNEFKEEVPTLELPTDFARPITKSYAGGKTGFELDQATSDNLKQIAEEEGATMFMTVLALYNILFSKIGDQEDIVVGTSTVGRQHADLEKIIGVFINTIPLRNYPKKEITFKEFLSDVKVRSLVSFDNQAYPYEALIEELNIARDVSRNPLFETFFQYNYATATATQQQNTSVEGKSLSTTELVSKFDISMRASKTEGKIRCIIEYATALFTEATINQFITYFKKITSAVIDNPDIRLSDINIITDEERVLLTDAFNNTTTDFPDMESLSALFDKQVERTPDAVAVVIEGESITYTELQMHANAIAKELILSHGIKTGDHVGLILRRDRYLLSSMLGVLRVGAAYVPIDPEYPSDRIAYVVENSGIEKILTTSALEEVYKSIEVSTIDVDQIPLIISDFPDFEEVDSEATAYMIYTSGSAGLPKGVSVSHRNVSNLIKGAMNGIGFEQGNAILCHTTIAFDIFVMESLLPLINGMKVVLATNNDQLDPKALVDLIQNENVETLQITPSQLKLLLLSGHNDILKTIQILILTGEALPEELLSQLKDQYTGKIFNCYGPTETTVWSTFQDLTYSKTLSIGKPISNTIIRILNKQGGLVPVGVNGELCIGGEGVSKGYWKNDDLTTEKFVNDPVSDGDIIYKTGDLARWLPDGAIQYVGRIDDQVKIRGNRIEIGEVEYQLSKFEGILESAVIVNDKAGDKYLAAYYTAGEELSTSEIKPFLMGKLPEYMIPSLFVQLDAIPLTPNKKTDRKALRNLEIRVGDDYEAPSTDTESKMIEIWSQVLMTNPDQISVNKSFFELGGHSLNAVTVVNKIFKVFNIEYTLRDLFFNPTVKAIAENIDARLWLGDDNNENDDNSATQEVLI